MFALLYRHQQGATAIEFALVAGVFFMLMFGILEYGMIMMTKIAIESATQQVARSEGIGTISGVDTSGGGCTDRACAVKALVAQKTRGLVHPESVIVTATVISNAASATPPTPDMCLDTPNNPFPADCKIYQDNNSNGQYDPANPLDGSALGSQDQLVEMRVTYVWQVLFPIFREHFGDHGALTISSSTVIRNQPFGNVK